MPPLMLTLMPTMIRITEQIISKNILTRHVMARCLRAILRHLIAAFFAAADAAAGGCLRRRHAIVVAYAAIARIRRR